MSASYGKGFGNWQNVLDDVSQTYCENRSAGAYKEFCALESNEERIDFIFQQRILSNVGWLQKYFAASSSWHGKSNTEASFWKAKGNKFFQLKKFALAVDAYTQSCLNASTTDGDDFTLSLGNRSAALFHLTHYQLCVSDINRAVAHKFPGASLHKLLARKTQAKIKLGQKDEAKESLQILKDFTESSEFSLQDEKKDNFFKEMKMMDQAIESLKEPTDKVITTKTDSPAVCGKVNAVISQATDQVAMAYTKEKGRHLLASSSISRGSTLIVEKPFAAVLLPDHYETHCHHCFSLLPLNCIGCQRCTSVRFCDEICRDASWSLYHATECPYLDLFHSVGIAHLSLRVILIASLPFLKDFLANEHSQRLSSDPCDLGINKLGCYDRSYLTVYDLMTHEDSTEGLDMLQYSMTAGLLLLTLAHSGFFPTTDEEGKFDLLCAVLKNKSTVTLPIEMRQVGGLLLRHILQLVCNAHAITSIQADTKEESEDCNVSATEQTRIATAIYPTASLMNHSCDPTISSSFICDTLIVRCVKDVAEGQEIFNCYGPHCCRMDREERQAVLQAQYHFTCCCQACVGGGMDHRRFGAFKCPRCAGVLWESSCLECNITIEKEKLSRLKSEVADCQRIFDNALGLMNGCQYDAASALFEQCLKKRKEILFKDHRDIALAQDATAKCYASLGDFCTAADNLQPSVEFARLLYGPTSPEYGHELHKLAEVLFNADRICECVDACGQCLKVMCELYPKGHQVIRDVMQLSRAASQALVPQVNKM